MTVLLLSHGSQVAFGNPLDLAGSRRLYTATPAARALFSALVWSGESAIETNPGVSNMIIEAESLSLADEIELDPTTLLEKNVDADALETDLDQADLRPSAAKRAADDDDDDVVDDDEEADDEIADDDELDEDEDDDLDDDEDEDEDDDDEEEEEDDAFAADDDDEDDDDFDDDDD